MKKQEMKYELTKNKKNLANGNTLYQIRALRDIDSQSVKAGDVGGYVQNPNTLSQEGDCWVDEQAYVCDQSKVTENALVSGFASVSGKSLISGNARVHDNSFVNDSTVREQAVVCDRASVSNSTLLGDSYVAGNAYCSYVTAEGTVLISDNTKLTEVRLNGSDVKVLDNATIHSAVIGNTSAMVERVLITDNAVIEGCGLSGSDLTVAGDARMTGAVRMSGRTITVQDLAEVYGMVDLYSNVRVVDLVKITNNGTKIMVFENETLAGDMVVEPNADNTINY